MWGRKRTTSNKMNCYLKSFPEVASERTIWSKGFYLKFNLMLNGIDDVVVFVLLIMLSRYILSPWKDIPHENLNKIIGRKIKSCDPEDKAASHGSKGLIRLTLEINGMSHVIQRPSIQVARTKVWPSGFNFQQPNPLLCYFVVQQPQGFKFPFFSLLPKRQI